MSWGLGRGAAANRAPVNGKGTGKGHRDIMNQIAQQILPCSPAAMGAEPGHPPPEGGKPPADGPRCLLEPGDAWPVVQRLRPVRNPHRPPALATAGAHPGR